jgi:carboxypeptidase C (cathepsin A)
MAEPKPETDKPTERPPLPADVETRHRLEAGGRVLDYAAIAGSIPLRDAKGKREADVYYTYYFTEGETASARPITFCFNGGPGAASVFLHLGMLGPRIVGFGNQGDEPSAPIRLTDNADTWLDFTDLVFVDPVGTGWSRTAYPGEEAEKKFWGMTQDIESLATAVTAILTKHRRMASPKAIMGESYGGYRGPRLAQALATEKGVAIRSLVLMSPALDFSLLPANDFDPRPWAVRLPSMAAAALERHGPVTPEMLVPAEDYARGAYMSDLVQGRRDPAALARMAETLGGLIGLPAELIKRLGGRIDMKTFQRELHRSTGEVVSVYDASVRAYDPFPTSGHAKFDDPLLVGILAPTRGAMIEHAQTRLGYFHDEPYLTLNGDLHEKWELMPKGAEGKEVGFGAPNSAMDDLRRILALDPALKVIIPHGMTDLITPYYASRYLVDQLPPYGDPERIRVLAYPGGHMFYTRPESRAAVRADAEALYRE